MKNKTTAIVLTLVLLVMVGIGAAVVSAEETDADAACSPIRDRMGWRGELTDDMKEEMAARREAMIAAREKWDALTDEQKDEIYDLEDQIGALRGQIINRYQQWGIMDEETAAGIQERITERLSNMREEGRMPMGGGRMGRRGGWGPPPLADAPEGVE